MASKPLPAQAKSDSTKIPVRRITGADVDSSLRDGWRDFMEMRGDIIFLMILYPLIGIVAAIATVGGPLLPLFLPIAAGIGLLGPVAAVGFYEMARRREMGLHSNWPHFLDVRKRPSFDEIAAVSGLLLAIFGLWLLAAGGLYVALFGWNEPESTATFINQVFTTSQGWAMIVIGGLIGLVFAAIVLALSVVSMPMLVDYEVSASAAVKTSIRASRANAGPMLRWGVIVAALLIAGSIPLFIGLAVVLPWLGYATWHLYTKLVDRSAIPTRRRE
ncbi:MAG TPA: DUF2189 domain-containing protein [Sphingomicrobium sp.]|nr:DUF2189 domain-containing protein [Sphingomicrobium sp.]